MYSRLIGGHRSQPVVLLLLPKSPPDPWSSDSDDDDDEFDLGALVIKCSAPSRRTCLVLAVAQTKESGGKWETEEKGPGVGLTFCGGHNTKRNPLDKFSYLCRPDDDIIFNTTAEICM